MHFIIKLRGQASFCCGANQRRKFYGIFCLTSLRINFGRLKFAIFKRLPFNETKINVESRWRGKKKVLPDEEKWPSESSVER